MIAVPYLFAVQAAEVAVCVFVAFVVLTFWHFERGVAWRVILARK